MTRIKLVRIKFEKNNQTPPDSIIPQERLISTHLINSIIKEENRFVLTIDTQAVDLNQFIGFDNIEIFENFTIFSELYESDVKDLFNYFQSIK